MTEYDGNSNPRSLRSATTEDETSETLQQIELAEKELGNLNKVIGLYNSKGWNEVVKPTLYDEINRCMRLLASASTDSMAKVEHIRGELAAYHRFVTMGEEATKRKDALVEAVRNAKEAVDA